MNEPEPYEPLPAFTAIAFEVNTNVEHVVSAEPLACGAYARKVIVPSAVGFTRPLIVALSLIDPPRVIGPAALVTTAGVTLFTVLFSPVSSQCPVTGRLLPSPLKDAIHS